VLEAFDGWANRPMTKHNLFQWYGWIGLAMGVVLVGLSLALGGQQALTLVAASISTTVGFVYFVQQQKLAEAKLFLDLFSRFNERYDQMNAGLYLLAKEGADSTNVAEESKSLIVDYFNLCAEEYHFYRQGYIPPVVWRSWCLGMLWYLRRHPFKDVWNEEVKLETFYGLTTEEIERGARLKAGR
jgi:hypothetical protein